MIEVKGRPDWSAQVVRVPAVVELPGLDNLRGVPILGSQALVQKTVQPGDLMLYFPAEVQLSEAYARANNMHRHPELNADPQEKGYLEDNRRVKALKMRGHRSDALLVGLDTLTIFLGTPRPSLKEGDVFDTINGVEICRKYVPVGVREPRNQQKAERRVPLKVFPEHIDTDNYQRNRHKIRLGAGPLLVTQKLHGTSGRWGRVPIKRKLRWFERLAKRLGVQVEEHEYQLVAGSRKVVKGDGASGFYATDIWTEYAEKIGPLIPEGFIVYGEIIGWTSDGSPIQKNYTYNLPKGRSELYVYRVARIDARGVLTDLAWPAVRDFAHDRGLKTVPEVEHFFSAADLDLLFTDLLDLNFAKTLVTYDNSGYDTGYHGVAAGWEFREAPVPLSDPRSADEGFVVRQDGRELLLLKAKSPAFLRHESAMNDKGVIDLETAEAA